MTALHALHDPDAGVLLNVGEIAGGTRRNLFAARAMAWMDVRVVDAPAWDRTRARIEAIAATEEPPGTPDDPAPVPASAAEAATAMGTRIETVATMGRSDANLIASQGIPALCGLDPVGGAVMTREEYIELATLPERAALVAALAHGLSLGRLKA